VIEEVDPDGVPGVEAAAGDTDRCFILLQHTHKYTTLSVLFIEIDL